MGHMNLPHKNDLILRHVIQKHVLAVYELHGRQAYPAAKALGIHAGSLYRMLRAMGKGEKTPGNKRSRFTFKVKT